ncbi:hypothetical protein FCX55_22060 [Escherichia coli]|nr:hypothetical protein [Escherichia coli]
MAHDVPLGCAPDEYDDLISGTCSHLPEYIALLQDDVDPKNATEERHCCWQIEEVSGFVTPEKRSPAIIAGGAVQLIIVCL